jgi:2-methylcitrate dehydratase PrpD
VEHLDGYRLALTDWLACAHAGRRQPAARAAIAVGDSTTERIVAAAAAGHVLDFDDTYLPGLAHLSAATAPVAVVVGGEIGATVGQVLHAYAAGFEAMGAVAAASHPALYHRGWHPTAVCGAVGAAVTAAHLLDLDAEATATATNLAVLGAGGFRAAFGSDGKSLQVGLAAASGALAASLARAGAEVPARTLTGADGFEAVFGGRWAAPDPERPAISENWLKRYPCCLQTHGAIEAAVDARSRGASAAGRGCITVHPISPAAATHGPDVTTGLEAKFSIPYCTALAVVRGHPGLGDLERVDPQVRRLAQDVEVRTDATLLESEARLVWTQPDGSTIETSTTAAVGSPERPMDDQQLEAKLRDLDATALVGQVADLEGPAAALAEVLR